MFTIHVVAAGDIKTQGVVLVVVHLQVFHLGSLVARVVHIVRVTCIVGRLALTEECVKIGRVKAAAS